VNHVSTDVRPGFRVVAGNDHAQVATLTLEPGEVVGGPGNVHPDSDQWVFVRSGHGEATVAGETVPLEPDDLLLIEQGEGHELASTGSEPLATLSVYAPPRSDLQAGE
jgi:mannose-6-phosphate isomerase-like protein (cupin superfamily)